MLKSPCIADQPRRRCTLIAAAGAWLLALPSPASFTHAPERTGTLEGRVTFVGGAPAPVPVPESGESQAVLHVDPSGGLRYAVVFVRDARPATSVPDVPVTLNQRRFVFEPQVLAVRAGQAVRFTNSDPANHNVRARDANPSNTFSINTAAGTPGRERRLAPMPDGGPLELSCDLHPWMAAWVYVFEHDQFAVTNTRGAFRIARVLPGRHRVSVRQPAGRLGRDVTVEVRPAETTRVDVRFSRADISVTSRYPSAHLD